jgi:hypothetical protein
MGSSATFAPAVGILCRWHAGLAVACAWARDNATVRAVDVAWSFVCVFVAGATLAVLVIVGLMAGCAPADPAVLRAAYMSLMCAHVVPEHWSGRHRWCGGRHGCICTLMTCSCVL